MKIQIDRGDLKECKSIKIQLDEDTVFTISLSVDNKIVINKSNIDDNRLLINPRYSNEIEVF